MKQKDLLSLLKKNGFELTEGAKHIKAKKGSITEMIPRHKDVNELLAKAIIKRQGLK